MTALLPAPSRPARRIRRIALAASATALGAGILLAPSPASAADNFGPGYPIPASSGTGTSHIGAYSSVPGLDGLAYCADPDRTGPDTADGYGAVSAVSTWSSSVTGKPISSDDLHRAAFVLSRYATVNDAQAAAVDASVNSYLNPGTDYALPDGERAVQRLSYPDVAPEAKTDAATIMRDADEYAGPYTVHIDPAGPFSNGKATDVDVYVTSASGHKLPDLPINIRAASGKDSVPVTLTTNDSGDTAGLNVSPDDNAAVTITAEATLPSLVLRTAAPHNGSAQRLVLAGGSSTAQAKVTFPNSSTGGGTIKVTKTAAGTGKAMSGVEFALKDATGKSIADGKTNASGVWQAGPLPAGKYTLHEVRAAVGYKLAADRSATITAGKTTALTVKDVKIPASTAPTPRPVTIPQLPQTGA